MKVVVLFLLFALAFVLAESQKQIDDQIICVERADTLKLLYGRDGICRPGPPGEKGIRGPKGFPGLPGEKGERGWSGLRGVKGAQGLRGAKGDYGAPGPRGVTGKPGVDGDEGYGGDPGPFGDEGPDGMTGAKGVKGERGVDGLPAARMEVDMEKYILHDYYVIQSGYYNNLYHVTSRHLTDGRTDTGGWGSEKAKAGNHIQATYVRPVYVTSVTVAGGYIPSWGHGTKRNYGKLDLEYSYDGKTWLKARTFPSPVTRKMIFYDLLQPVTAQYWRLKSTQDKWVGTTEFALRPLIRP